MHNHQPEEYNDPIYGTGHADYQKENGRNEFEYPTSKPEPAVEVES